MYTWRFGTGDVMHSTERVANYTWTEAGVYTITLTAENKVSNVQVTVSFIIVVTMLKIILELNVVGQVSKFSDRCMSGF